MLRQVAESDGPVQNHHSERSDQSRPFFCMLWAKRSIFFFVIWTRPSDPILLRANTPSEGGFAYLCNNDVNRRLPVLPVFVVISVLICSCGVVFDINWAVISLHLLQSQKPVVFECSSMVECCSRKWVLKCCTVIICLRSQLHVLFPRSGWL